MQKTYLVKQKFFMNGSYEEGKTVTMDEQVARAFIPNFLQEVIVKNAAPQSAQMPNDDVNGGKADTVEEIVSDNVEQQKNVNKNRKIKKG